MDIIIQESKLTFWKLWTDLCSVRFKAVKLLSGSIDLAYSF